jgi:hypothetical protein
MVAWYWLVVAAIVSACFGASIMALAAMAGRDNASW